MVLPSANVKLFILRFVLQLGYRFAPALPVSGLPEVMLVIDQLEVVKALSRLVRDVPRVVLVAAIKRLLLHPLQLPGGFRERAQDHAVLDPIPAIHSEAFEVYRLVSSLDVQLSPVFIRGE